MHNCVCTPLNDQHNQFETMRTFDKLKNRAIYNRVVEDE